MRPVNLIPPEQRRGDQAGARSGPFAYVLVGALCLALLAVVALVMTGNQISDRQAEAARLTAQERALQTQAQRLSGYTDFRFARLARLATVKSLADSRFDWERVMRELSRVLPDDVWLVQLAGTVSPEVNLDDAPGLQTRASIPGPALEMVGCAPGQDAVAGFISSLRDIDGVTRVGLESSDRPEIGSATGASVQSGANSGGSGEECRTRDFIVQFKLVVAFDAAPSPATTVPSAPSASPTETATDSTATPTSTATETGG